MSAQSRREDSELIEALLKKSPDAYRALVARYHGRLVATARAMVGPALAEEIVQDAWISAIRALPKFEKRSSLYTWLTRIVINECKNYLRKEDRYRSLEAMGFDASDPYAKQFDDNGHWASGPVAWHIDTPDDLLSTEQLNECISLTLQKLPPLQRAAFVLKNLQGLDYDDICNILAVSSSNVRVLLHRAKATLMKTIEHYQVTGQCHQ